MENNETEIGGKDPIKGFKITASINFEIKFAEQGIEMSYEPKTTANHLIALLIAHDVARNAKANFNANMEVIKHDPKMMDRLNWAGKTITGLDIFIDSFSQAVIDENTIPEMVPAEIETLTKTDSGTTTTITGTVTKQQIPTEE